MRLLGAAFLSIAILVSGQVKAQDAPSPRARADAARHAGDPAGARSILARLLKDAPDDADLRRRMAMAMAADGDLDAGLAEIERGVALAPNDLDVRLAYAHILYWRGDLAASRREADAVGAVSPDYPELVALQANIARASLAESSLPADEADGGVYMRAVAVLATLSDIHFANRGGQTWSNQQIFADFALDRNLGITASIEREKRTTADTRISIRGDYRFVGGFAYVGASFVPDAEFRESWSIASGGELRATDALNLLIDARYSDFSAGDVGTLQTGLRYTLSRDLALSVRAINMFGGGRGYRIGVSVRGDYTPASNVRSFLIAASYPDVEAGIVRQMRSGALGITLPLSECVEVTAAGAYDNRANSYERLSGTVGVKIRIGSP